MSVKIWCPQCHKQYALQAGEGLVEKRVTCKQCENKFRVGDAMQPPETVETNSPNNKTGDEIVAPPRAQQSAQRPSNLPSSHTTSPVDMSQFFIGSATRDLNAPQSENGERTLSSPIHVVNPWMIPAILAAIFFSLFLLVAAFSWRAYHIVNQAQVATREAQTTPTQLETGALPPKATPPNRSIARNNTNSSAGSDFDEDLNLESTTAMRDQRSAAEQQFKNEDEQIARDRQQFEKQRQAQLERDTQRRATAKKERDARQEHREQQRLEREERKRLLDEQKLRLDKLERDADSQPLENLVARIPTKAWGATSLAMGSKRFLFMGTTKGVQVYDCKRKKVADDTEQRGWDQRVECLALNQQRRMLAAGCGDGSIQLFSVSNKGKLKPLSLLSHDSRAIKRLVFNKDGTGIVSIGTRGDICFWDVKKEQLIKSDNYFDRPLAAASVDSESSQIRMSDGKQWKIANFADGEIVTEGSYPFRFSRGSTYLSHPTRVVHPNGSEIKIYQEAQADPILEMKGNGVQWTAVSEGAGRILTGGTAHVYQWDTTDGRPTHVWAIPDASYIQIISVSADGSVMAATSTGPNQDVYVFDLALDKTTN